MSLLVGKGQAEQLDQIDDGLPEAQQRLLFAALLAALLEALLAAFLATFSGE